MSMLPRTFSLPSHRILRCPRLLEIASELFDVDIEVLTEGFYDMLELTYIEPENFPPFYWFIITEDQEDPDLIWLLSDSEIQIGVKLLNENEGGATIMEAERVPTNTTENDMEIISSLTFAINDALRERFNDENLSPILERVPTPSNGFLFSRPGILVGKFKLSEDDLEYKPFILEQISKDNYSLYLSDEEFMLEYCKRNIKEQLGTDSEIILDEKSILDNNDSPGLIEGLFKLPDWVDYEIFSILFDPKEYKDCEVLIPVQSIHNYILTAISKELDVKDTNLIEIKERPCISNNYLCPDMSEDYFKVYFSYLNQDKIAIIYEDMDDDTGNIKTFVEISEA